MARPLKFLLLTTFYPPYSFGGDAMCVFRLAHALADEGHQVDVIHCVDSYYLLDPAGRPGAIEDRPNLRVHSLRSGFGSLSPMLSHQTGHPHLKQKRIREIVNSSRPDVIHFHNVSLFGPKIMALKPAAGEALKFYTTHEYWLICPTHVLWKFNRRACEKPDCIRCMLMARRPPQLWRYLGTRDRYASEVDVFLSPSRFAAQMHARRGFTRPMTYLPTFADLPNADDPVAAPVPRPRPHPRPYFLFVGRLEPIKGVRSLIEAWNKTSEADLLVAGDGGEAPDLKRLAAGNPRVRFLGFKTQQELGPLYANCVACIVPSVMYEVFTTVVLEAFARKAPVIARDHGPLREMIGDSRGGLLYRSEAELLGLVARLAQDSSLRTELGENGFTMVTNRWSRQAHLRTYFDLIREAAQRKFGRIPWEE
ncbi:MAG TPA: glycosyltransferase family 4 protein [Candidatus Binataceae bacterium]|nr:glycosyltransferase family 4 protein [Candidatus Binataceae bacterium]